MAQVSRLSLAGRTACLVKAAVAPLALAAIDSSKVKGCMSEDMQPSIYFFETNSDDKQAYRRPLFGCN